MAIKDSFFTILQPAQGIYKEKGSRFISHIYPIIEESQVKACIENLSREHPKARHICYAYCFGPDPDYSRHQDAGEPGGSAGLPILAQLKSHELQNVLLVVVRYFGGTLLGASGLGTAYKLSAADAINNAKIIERTRYAYFNLAYGYPMDKKIKFWLKSLDGKILSQEFMDNIRSRIAIPKSLQGGFNDLLQQETLTQQWPETIDCHWTGTDPF